MTLEACLHLSTIRAYCQNPRKEKLSLLPHRAARKESLTPEQSSWYQPFHAPRQGRRGVLLFCDAKDVVDEVVAVDDASWDNAVAACSSCLVLVQFWAPLCGPCRMFEPVIDELAKDYAGKLSCYKVNTDTCPDIASKYGIRSIPTLLLFENGEKKECVIGMVPKRALCATIDKYLKV